MAITASPIGMDTTDAEYRVIIRGLNLDAATIALIDAAIRSAVLKELATSEPGNNFQFTVPAQDPLTRSIFGLPLATGGMVAKV